MILGSDRRPKNNVEGGSGARSDTILLVRLNPEKDATAMMSLPRDLKVQIPGHGTDKINAAYELGGPRLTLKTVKQLTGLSINHVINVSFGGFWRAVNAIGCVYVDVDRRYFNDNPLYAPIDVQPGYQRLCARKALQYVRFRHEDNDLVRSARQQDFLRQTKQQVNYTDLIEKRDRLVKIFGRNTTTDKGLHSRAEVLRLLKLAVFSAGRPVREVHFEGLIGPSYVEASDERVKKLAQEFLDVRGHARAARQAEGEAPSASASASRRPARQLGLEDATSFGRDAAVQAVEQGLGKTLPVLFPRLRTKGSLYAGPPRVYRIWSDGKPYASYRMVLNRSLGVASTTASRAPPGRTRRSSRTPPRRGRSAAASTSCTTTATGCAWWRSTPRRAPTGSRTRCSSRCPRRR